MSCRKCRWGSCYWFWAWWDRRISRDFSQVRSGQSQLWRNSLRLIRLFTCQGSMRLRWAMRCKRPCWILFGRLSFGSWAFPVIICLGISSRPEHEAKVTSWNFLSGTKQGLILWLCFLSYLWLSSSLVISKLDSWAGLTISVLTSKAKAPKFL